LRDTYRCAACSARYHPKVVSQSDGSRLLAIGAGLLAPFAALAVVMAILSLARSRGLPLDHLSVGLGGLMGQGLVAVVGRAWRRTRSRPVYDPSSGRAPRYGEALLECPQCGSREAELATR